jgi:outer membrane protein W
MNTRLVTATILMAMGFTQGTQAQDAGEWSVGAGFHAVQPKSHNHALVDIDDATGLTFDVTYMLEPSWSLELLAALPFIHEITLHGSGAVAETDQLPLTLSAQYRLVHTAMCAHTSAPDSTTRSSPMSARGARCRERSSSWIHRSVPLSSSASTST